MAGKLKFVAAVLAAAVVAAPSAHAQTVDLNDVESVFSNPVGGNVTFISAQGPLSVITWGDANGESGYSFAGLAPQLSLDLSDGFELFQLGTFSHSNFPITAGTGISSVNFTAFLTFGGVATALEETFLINHFETPNAGNPCADGGTVGVGVNVNGCADQVTFASNPSSQVVEIDGQNYFLSLTGFSTTFDPNAIVEEFWTVENSGNEAALYATLQLVPEPASFALMSMGLLGLGVVARRRNRVS